MHGSALNAGSPQLPKPPTAATSKPAQHPPGHVGADGDEEHVGAKVNHPLADLAEVHAHAGRRRGGGGGGGAAGTGAAGAAAAGAAGARGICEEGGREGEGSGGSAVRRDRLCWEAAVGQNRERSCRSARICRCGQPPAVAASFKRTLVQGLAAREVAVVVHHHTCSSRGVAPTWSVAGPTAGAAAAAAAAGPPQRATRKQLRRQQQPGQVAVTCAPEA